jgi:thymidylate synthase (FAD)
MSLTENQLNEILNTKITRNQTLRPTVEELEQLLFEPLKVLDKGFIRVIDYMGDDNAIVQAARVSYGKGTKKSTEDQGLINYLMRHKHTTPFEMCEIKFHLKMPIFVARQWIRHRMASVNEYSARYSILSKEFYIPNKEDIAPQSTLNKQGRENGNLSQQEIVRVLDILKQDAEQCYHHYEEMLNVDEQGQTIDSEKQGIARELARINLTLNYYTEFYWKIDLHNLLHFLKLRADNHAQYEIRAYAKLILNIVEKWVPCAFHAFDEYVMKGVILSGKAVELIKQLLRGDNLSFKDSGLSKREWGEIVTTFGIKENTEQY